MALDVLRRPFRQAEQLALLAQAAGAAGAAATVLMQRLIETAKARGIKTMHSNDAADNRRMRQFAQHLKFKHERDPEDPALVIYSIDLETI